MIAIHNRQKHALHYLFWVGLLLLSVVWQAKAQSKIAIGDWQLHVPYQQAKSVELAGEKIYVAADRGLFYYDSEFNSVETITKVDGLSEQLISDIAYDEATKTLVVAYANTKVDLLVDDAIYSISDIFRKRVTGEKRINNVYVHNKLAYIATSFGVVVLDLQKREVRSTYSNLGPAGEVINATGTAIIEDIIYLATNYGVLEAPRTGANLQDYQSWKNISSNLEAAAQVEGLAAFNGRLYANAGGTVYAYAAGEWRTTAIASGAAIRRLSATNAYLAVATAAGVVLLNTQGQIYTLSAAATTQPYEAVATAEGTVWVADFSKGLVRVNLSSSDATTYTPNGPSISNGFKFYTYGSKVYLLGGGYSEDQKPFQFWNGFDVYDNGGWQSYNRAIFSAPGFVAGQDLASIVFNPVTNKLYLASYGSGLIEWEGPEKGKIYNQTNSPLLGTAIMPGDVRLTSLAVDADGNVWVLNPHQRVGAAPVHKLAADGTWQSYTIPGLSSSNFLDHLVLDDYGQKWLSYSNANIGGVVVFDEQQNRAKRLSTGEGNGGLPNTKVYSVAKDLNGDIWVGTGSGVGVYYNPGFVFESNLYDARIPIIDGRPLLEGQVVRTIAVDGANRKWMGTDNGLWLFGPDGDELLAHYTSQNSPLPSDSVVSVAVAHQSGEVFIATGAGVASFRSSATVTEGEPACAVVFPNPVRPNYTGQVGVSGLPNNADVRITDMSGTLVYRGKATGGTFAWNVRDYNGKRVKAGVYLVLSASADGGQTCISKIAVLD